jgi:hypothetical protein
LPPWYALINRLMNRLEIAPTFPLMVGALLRRGLLPTSDPREGGWALFNDMVTNPYLDSQRMCVSVKKCDDLKGPVFRLRPRTNVYNEGAFPSVFPAGAASVVRLRFADNIFKQPIGDLLELYDQFYALFKHDQAMESGQFSRNRKDWVDSDKCKHFETAIVELTKVSDRLTPVAAAPANFYG